MKLRARVHADERAATHTSELVDVCNLAHEYPNPLSGSLVLRRVIAEKATLEALHQG